jgi:hypothetical protein
VVARTREPVPRVLAAAAADERSGPASEAGTLDPVDTAPLVEDASRVDPNVLDRRRALRDGVDLGR